MDKYIVRKQEIESLTGTAKTPFLNSNAQRINKSLGDMTGLYNIGFHLIEVEPGHESTEFHRHLYEEECVYILEGEAESLIGDEKSSVAAGDFIGYRAGGEAHKLTNTGSTTLKCLVAGRRLAHDISEYPDRGKRLYRNTGLPWDMVSTNSIEHPQVAKK